MTQDTNSDNAAHRWWQRPSILPLAMAQVALSSVLYELSPYQLHRGFRVGPGYFQ